MGHRYSIDYEIKKIQLQKLLQKSKFIIEGETTYFIDYELNQFDQIIKILEDYKNGNLQPVEEKKETEVDDDNSELEREETTDEKDNEPEVRDGYVQDPCYRRSEIKDIPLLKMNDYKLVDWVQESWINPKFLKYNTSPGAQALLKKMVSPKEYQIYLRGCQCRTPIPTIILQNMVHYLSRTYLLNRCICNVDYKNALLFTSANGKLSANPTAMGILKSNQFSIDKNLLSTNPSIFVKVNQPETSSE